jgi:hypothetical protein
VCTGIARTTDTDVTLVRLAFIVSGLTGLGVIAYVLLWILVPKEDPAAGRTLTLAAPDTARWIRIVLVAAAALGLAGLLGGPFGGDEPGFFHGLVLLAPGAGYLRSRRRDTATPLAAGAPAGTPAWTAPPTPGAPVTAPFAPPAPPSTPPTEPLPTPQPAAGPPPRRTSGALLAARIIGWLAVAGAIMGAAAFTFAVALGAIDVRLPVLAGGVALASIVSLVGTSAAAKSPGPILASLALVAGAGVLTLALVDWDGGVGERINQPESLDEVRSSYDMFAGRRVLDLSAVEFGESPVRISIDHNLGEVEVVVPDSVTVEADVRVSAGEAKVLGRSESGFDVDVRVVDDSVAGGSGRLELDIEMGFGSAQVCRSNLANGGQLGCLTD